MKNLLFFLAFVLFINFSFAQKKKTTSKATSTAVSKSKVDNLNAEVKGKTFQVTISEKGKANDAIIVKELNDNLKPIDIKLTSFTATGTKLYLLQWTEKTNTKTDVKTENITIIYSVIYEITNKKQVFSNFEKTNNIVEKVFLDKNKNASETQEKIRREGFVFTLNPDGTIAQKNKTQENKWVYDATKMEFVGKK
jgi:hypothetical protein